MTFEAIATWEELASAVHASRSTGEDVIVSITSASCPVSRDFNRDVLGPAVAPGLDMPRILAVDGSAERSAEILDRLAVDAFPAVLAFPSTVIGGRRRAAFLGGLTPIRFYGGSLTAPAPLGRWAGRITRPRFARVESSFGVVDFLAQRHTQATVVLRTFSGGGGGGDDVGAMFEALAAELDDTTFLGDTMFGVSQTWKGLLKPHDDITFVHLLDARPPSSGGALSGGELAIVGCAAPTTSTSARAVERCLSSSVSADGPGHVNPDDDPCCVATRRLELPPRSDSDGGRAALWGGVPAWVMDHTLPLFAELTAENMRRYWERDVPIAILYLPLPPDLEACRFSDEDTADGAADAGGGHADGTALPDCATRRLEFAQLEYADVFEDVSALAQDRSFGLPDDCRDCKELETLGSGGSARSARCREVCGRSLLFVFTWAHEAPSRALMQAADAALTGLDRSAQDPFLDILDHVAGQRYECGWVGSIKDKTMALTLAASNTGPASAGSTDEGSAAAGSTAMSHSAPFRLCVERFLLGDLLPVPPLSVVQPGLASTFRRDPSSYLCLYLVTATVAWSFLGSQRWGWPWCSQRGSQQCPHGAMPAVSRRVLMAAALALGALALELRLHLVVAPSYGGGDRLLAIATVALGLVALHAGRCGDGRRQASGGHDLDDGTHPSHQQVPQVSGKDDRQEGPKGPVVHGRPTMHLGKLGLSQMYRRARSFVTVRARGTWEEYGAVAVPAAGLMARQLVHQNAAC